MLSSSPFNEVHYYLGLHSSTPLCSDTIEIVVGLLKDEPSRDYTYHVVPISWHQVGILCCCGGLLISAVIAAFTYTES